MSQLRFSLQNDDSHWLCAGDSVSPECIFIYTSNLQKPKTLKYCYIYSLHCIIITIIDKHQQFTYISHWHRCWYEGVNDVGAVQRERQRARDHHTFLQPQSLTGNKLNLGSNQSLAWWTEFKRHQMQKLINNFQNLQISPVIFLWKFLHLANNKL